jgi:hypothetical protein
VYVQSVVIIIIIIIGTGLLLALVQMVIVTRVPTDLLPLKQKKNDKPGRISRTTTTTAEQIPAELHPAVVTISPASWADICRHYDLLNLLSSATTTLVLLLIVVVVVVVWIPTTTLKNKN